ncbi:VanZ family protein [Phycicoccus sonneratiae]|uniref:VanZ family protein n=1 Tax=Phycicoccus sonneratiae TaxID=2807628 RepID=A0ABS2CLV9_9MICO|nr:VanZ family protein [Phycicoccus sonneraticus]MBM6400866.1 VanZ family protein [Phycicoccus sonneraticus]
MSDRPAARRLLRAGLVLAVVLQLVVLYLPRDPGPLPFPQADKVVHLTVFLLPALLGLLAGLPARWVVGVLAAHAVLSEVVQATLLPVRSGDPLDAVADLVGVGLGVLLARVVGPRVARRASGTTSARW